MSTCPRHGVSSVICLLYYVVYNSSRYFPFSSFCTRDNTDTSLWICREQRKGNTGVSKEFVTRLVRKDFWIFDPLFVFHKTTFSGNER